MFEKNESGNEFLGGFQILNRLKKQITNTFHLFVPHASFSGKISAICVHLVTQRSRVNTNPTSIATKDCASSSEVSKAW